jgi:hypothetical protein
VAVRYIGLHPDLIPQVLIDCQLVETGWSVQDSRSFNLFAAQGVARREATTATGHGRADYLPTSADGPSG